MSSEKDICPELTCPRFLFFRKMGLASLGRRGVYIFKSSFRRQNRRVRLGGGQSSLDQTQPGKWRSGHLIGPTWPSEEKRGTASKVISVERSKLSAASARCRVPRVWRSPRNSRAREGPCPGAGGEAQRDGRGEARGGGHAEQGNGQQGWSSSNLGAGGQWPVSSPEEATSAAPSPSASW